MYVLTSNNFYIGTDYRGCPNTVTSKTNALTFKTRVAAVNYLSCIPCSLKNFNWSISSYDEDTDEIDFVPELKKFGNPTKTTSLEDDDFDICEFFSNTINVMSQLDRFIANMTDKEQITDMKILDIRHYIRNNNHKLNAVQMQRLGYYLRDLEKERYRYKSNRLIASMFASNIDALKDKKNIQKMTDVITSKYNPKILDDNDIEYIINKKKDIEIAI